MNLKELLTANPIYKLIIFLKGGRNKMKKIILTTTIKRQKGFIYCCSTDSNGCLTIMEIPAGRKRKDAKANPTTSQPATATPITAKKFKPI